MDQPVDANPQLEKGAQLGQYTILARIGAGGMGEVYRARDTRLNRDVAIKVLPSFFSNDPDRLRRFEQEARAAAALNHPNILAVFQMGTYEGSPYLVSELLEGATLREQLKRGPLPLRKVIDCGTQIARGLAAAHEKGIVHRDLKPENLFVTKDGRVKILDFGLAELTETKWPLDSKAPTVSRATEPGVVMGTVGYMSPEQVSGKAADHRTDIFGFGAVLYEMLTGKRAFQEPTSAETMSAILNEDPPGIPQIAPTTPPALQRLLHRCLEKNPEQRFHSSSDLAFALEALSESSSVSPAAIARRTSRRIWPLAGAALVLVTLSLAVGGYFHSRRPPKLTEKDAVVIADFTNTTGDPVFDSTLRQGLSVQLQQTPFLRLVSADQIAQTLRLMEKSPDTRLTHDVAREVCERANATTTVEGSIAALGNQYVLGLDAVNCRTGETMASEQVTAEAKEKLLAALGNAASRLRSKLGESHASLEAHDAPLDQFTTSSLEALQALALGSQAFNRGDMPTAASHLKRAVALDPNFATAHVLLGTVYVVLGDDSSAERETNKAFDLRDRATEYERFAIEADYHFAVTRDWDKMALIGKAWVQAYPRDANALINLGFSSGMLGRFDDALAPIRQAARLEPTAAAQEIIASLCVGQNRLGEAEETIRQARARHLDDPSFSEYLYLIAFLKNDASGMSEQASASASWRPVGEGDFVQSNTAAYRGHLSKARDLSQRAVGSALAQQTPGLAKTYEALSAVRETLFGNLDTGRMAPMPTVGNLLPLDAEGYAGLALALAGNAPAAAETC
jgi:serine/threonine protein kinase/Flp pilus assembly protein TadD